MTMHILEADGAAKCGCNVYNAFNGEGQPLKRKVYYRNIYFADPTRGQQPTCKRCLNRVERPQVVAPTEDLTGQVFHRSFGYDMTINVFARPVKRTPKGYICRILESIEWGDPNHPSGTGKSRASSTFAENEKPFLMTKKRSARGYEYWTGGGHSWSLEDADKSFYENHCD